MAKYPIKMLKDEEGNAFVPLTSSEALKTPDGKTLDEKLQNKLETTNIKAGTDINITVDGNNVTINNASKGVLIDNLTTETSGIGSLDAHQGKVLKEMIPEVVNNVTSTDSDKALSAYQGYLLSGKVVPTGGKKGQVLKKSSDTNWSLEWGDAADPNAIIGDGSIKKIVELTYEEYQALETIDPDTEYHIIDAQSAIDNLQATLDSLQSQLNEIKSTYLPLTGGTVTGAVRLTKTSYNFNRGAIPGVKESSANTLLDLLTEVRYSNGQMGSVNFTSDYNSAITHGWWLYLYIPHRIGGVDGAKAGDNTDWGVLFLMGMTVQLGKMYTVNFQNGAISTIAEH